MRIAWRILLAACLLGLCFPALILGLYFFAPQKNARLHHVDVLIVLGCPAKADGTPTPEQRERVMEAVREFRNGIGNHIILTGAAAHNQFVEAHTMALFAEENGVPVSAIIEENQARDTIQNIYYSNLIMQANAWHSTEVISSPYHLPRTSLILDRYPQLQWTAHPAQWPSEYSLWRRLELDWKEAMTCFHIRMHGFRPSKYLPANG